VIGNDLVDLKAAREQSRAGEARFWQKVLNRKEWEFLSAPTHSPGARWICWAAKESAYKLERRQGRSRRFCPKSYTVDLRQGTVTGPHGRYPILILHSPQLVHVVCRMHPSLPVHYRIDRQGDLPDIYNAGWCLEKEETGALTVRNRNTGIQMPVSKSHHGQFQALAWSPVDPYAIPSADKPIRSFGARFAEPFLALADPQPLFRL